LSSIAVALVLSLTVITVVAAGIVTAYFSVTGILQAFSYRAPKPSRLVLVTSQTHASGD
jgi:hypothetical protein